MRRRGLLVVIFIFVFLPGIKAQTCQQKYDFISQLFLQPLLKTEVVRGKRTSCLQKKYIVKSSLLSLISHNSVKEKTTIMHDRYLLDKQKDARLSKQRISIIVISGVLLFVLAVGVFLFIYFRQRQRIRVKELDNLKNRNEIVQLEKFLEGEESERKRIAQDLHDGVSSELTIIKYALEVYKESMPSEFTKDVDSLVKHVDKILESVRSISFNFAPPVFKVYSLSESIKHFCERFSMMGDIKITFQKYGQEPVLSKNRKTAIYRIIQELVNNIRKHAKASGALVQVVYHPDTVHITVEDDGVGFNPRKTTYGLGLNNIRSRIKFLKAQYNIDSSEKGTTFIFEIPVS